MTRAERLAELAARLSDGESIDWVAERARSIDNDESRVVDELAAIHRLVAALRPSGAEPTLVVASGALAGTRIGPYRIEELIGRGGMGEVYRAHDERLGRFVAIKALSPALATDEFARRRFLRETRLACRVSHPYVATVHDVVEQDGRVLLVMEWLAGDRLDVLLATAPVPPARAAIYAREIAEALQAVHLAGIVHRDLKPGNVMLTPDGHVKVMDFGVALHVFEPDDERHSPGSVDRLTRDGRGVGTINYMSPEQLRGAGIDARSDLFALGIILWELLVGQHPFARPTAYETATAILNDPPGSTRDPEISGEAGELRRVVLRLLEKNPANRYADAAALVTDLDAIVSGGNVTTPPTPQPMDAPKPVPFRKVLGWAGIGVLVVAAAVGLTFRNGNRDRGGGGDVVRRVVAVLPFHDRGSSEPGSVRGELTASLVAAGLFESGVVRPVDLERMEALGAVSGPDAIDRLARSTRAEYVVGGDIWEEGGTLVGTVRVFRSGTGDPVATYPIRAGGSSGFAALASARVLDVVASARGATVAQRGAALGTTSDEARDAEFHARAATRVADYATAIAALESALKLDPAFVAARVDLAEALFRAGYGRRAREEADRALKGAQERGAQIPQRTTLDAKAVRAMVREDIEAELTARRDLTLRYRDDPGILASYADACRRAGKYDEALGAVAQAESIDPGDIRVLLVRARVLTAQGKFDEAKAVLDGADRILGDGAGVQSKGAVLSQRGQVAMSKAAYPAAGEQYRRAETLFGTAGLSVLAARARRSALDADVVQGKLAGTESEYASALQVFRAAGALQDVIDTLNASGGRDFLAGRFDRAEPTLRAALAEGRPLENPPLLVYPKLNLAALLNFTGRIAEGGGIAEEAVRDAREYQLRDPEALALSLLADAKAQQGRFVEAREDYLAVAGVARAPGGPVERLGYALLSAADLDDLMGALTPGLAEAEEAVTALRQRGQNVELAYALAIRARLEAQAANWTGASADLDEAAKLTAAAGDAMVEQTLRIALARAGLLLRRGSWSAAASACDSVRRGAAKIDAVSLAVPALIGLCRADLEQARLTAAEGACHEADVHVRALPNERAAAHAALAEIWLRKGRLQEAEQLALRAAGEAREIGLVPVGIDAGAVVAALPASETRAPLVAAAATMARGYLEALPPETRAAVRRRPDLEPALSRLKVEQR